MGDERFCLRKFQLEGVPDEAGEVAFHFLRFVAWPGKTKQKVIGRAQVTEPPIARVVWVARGQPLHLLAKRFGRLMVPRTS